MNKHFLLALFVAILSFQWAFAVPPDISAGGQHVLALKENGEVWAWGDNQEGQLGRPNSEGKSSEPIKVSFPIGRTAIAVAGGDRHSLGRALANPQHGSGRLSQLVIPDYQKALRPIYDMPLNPYKEN